LQPIYFHRKQESARRQGIVNGSFGSMLSSSAEVQMLKRPVQGFILNGLTEDRDSGSHPLRSARSTPSWKKA
jgi:hypothetical protein